MRTPWAGSIVVCLLIGSAAPAQQLTTEFAGVASGTVGSSAFDDATFSIVTESQVSAISGFDGGWLIENSHATISIDGIGVGEFTIPTLVFVNNGLNVVGLSRSDTLADLMDLVCDVDCSDWDLTSSFGPVFDPAPYATFQFTDAGTTLGSLTMRSVSDVVFTAELTPDLVRVGLDIRPGSDPNRLSPAGRAVVPVAILGSEDFEVADVDPETLAFGPGGAGLAPPGRPIFRDVDGDGIEDLLTHFRREGSGIAYGDVEACVSGTLRDGTPFEGCDSIVTLPARSSQRSSSHGDGLR